MAVWAAPFVADGESGKAEVWSRGIHHVVDVSLERLAQQPRVEHTADESDLVRTGALVHVRRPDSASLVGLGGQGGFHNAPLTASFTCV